MAPAQATTQTFTYTGAQQTFTVPAGVFSVHVVAIGGSGGTSAGAGGAAAQVTADLGAIPGQTLYVEVGGRGQDSGAGGAGGFNGGATGAAGGGGASDVRTSPGPGLSPDHRLIVAAGGGGGGATSESSTGGAGGAAGSAGANDSAGFNSGGGAGTQSTGGSVGVFSCAEGVSGQLGSGGAGGNAGSVPNGPGGGGAGGYYGGGGGGGGCSFGGGGGGGGSSLVPTGGSLALASLVTAPQLQITYIVPPSIAVVSPPNGATYTQGQVVAAVYSCTAPAGTGVTTCAGPVANGAAINTQALGQHTFTVKAQDTDGGAAAQSVSYTVVAAPAATALAPSVSSASESTKTWREDNTLPHISANNKKPPVGTTFSFALNEQATVKLSFTQQTAGRKVHGKCVAQTRKNRRKPSCTRALVAGTLTLSAHQGTNKVRFSGRISATNKLKPGRYTLQITATNAQGQSSTPRSLSFTIVK